VALEEKRIAAMPMLFVYGSLRRGMSHHHHMNGQRFVATARSAVKFTIEQLTFEGVPGSYPRAQESDEGEHLQGEIFEVDAVALQLLDNYEEYPALYDRREFAFITEAGEKIPALMYCGHRR
jgi:gamma-glutamylaminecyclotransferase